MKTSILFFLIPGLLLFSCKSGIDTGQEKEVSDTGENPPVFAKIDLDTLRGMYVGDFGGSDIRIVLNYVSPNHAVGYNLHKGLQRNISGKLEETENEIKMELHEPGDHKFDGTFYLTFNKRDLSYKGYWKSRSNKIARKNFTLKKRVSADQEIDLQNLQLSDINDDSFTNIFYYCNDSISDLYFEPDGSVRYEYYPFVDTEERTEQIVILKGTWSLRKDHVLVSWSNKNSIFPGKSTRFDINIAGEYEFYLVSKKRRFMANFFG